MFNRNSLGITYTVPAIFGLGSFAGLASTVL
jgi:hypothetical protein